MLIWSLLFLAAGAAGTWFARRYALARRLLDEPGDRRSHQVATPRGGGIAIVIAMLVAALVAWKEETGALDGMVLATFTAGLAAVAMAGWIDDHRPLSPWVRLLVHLLASAAFAAAILATGGHAGWVLLGFVAPLVLTNIWNFMDGINGLAASQALIVSALLALWLDGPWAFIALALAASVAGFLPFNFPKARIFLGDVGSGAIGYAIGGLCTMLAMQRPGTVGWVLLPLAPFLVDAGLTLGRRVLRGERWWTAHTQHAYQVGARRYGHVRITVAYALLTLTGVAIALSVERHSFMFIASSLCAWYISAAIVWSRLQHLQGKQGVGTHPSNKENG